jgi:hypothetical protein
LSAIDCVGQAGRPSASLTPLPGLLFVFFVNRNRVQILRFKYLSAIETSYIINAVPAVEELGSLVLTTLHSEITPILD